MQPCQQQLECNESALMLHMHGFLQTWQLNLLLHASAWQMPHTRDFHMPV